MTLVPKPTPKPIVVFRIPGNEAAETPGTIQRLQHSLSRQLYDYHVLIVIDRTIDSWKIECYQSPFTERQFNNLKYHLLRIIETKNTETNE
jgi:hypothetical protein